jgi:hypothetical protein
LIAALGEGSEDEDQDLLKVEFVGGITTARPRPALAAI